MDYQRRKAGTRIELVHGVYETPVLPLHSPAMNQDNMFNGIEPFIVLQRINQKVIAELSFFIYLDDFLAFFTEKFF